MSSMARVNRQIKRLAPVLNTQSYKYDFGKDVDTMLKWYKGSAYLFAMPSGATGSQPGMRTFQLPRALAGVHRVKVLNAHRSVPVRNGRFTDRFNAEYRYHIDKITPGR